MSRQSAEHRRQQLMDAAIGLFSVHGFDGTTTKAIAEAAGVTEALIFHYFPTKLALFHAIISEHGFRSLNPIQLDTVEEMPMPERLPILFNTFLDTLWKNRVAIRMLFGAALIDPVALKELKGFDARPRERLKLLLSGYEMAGEIRPGMAAPTAAVILAAMGGFLGASLRSEPEDWDTARTMFVKDLLTVILPGLRP